MTYLESSQAFKMELFAKEIKLKLYAVNIFRIKHRLKCLSMVLNTPLAFLKYLHTISSASHQFVK